MDPQQHGFIAIEGKSEIHRNFGMTRATKGGDNLFDYDITYASCNFIAVHVLCSSRSICEILELTCYLHSDYNELNA